MSFMSVLEKIGNFFAPEEEVPTGDPITYQGKVYVPYYSKDDQYAVWPNATDPICGGLSLKREMYWNKETETYSHPECLRGEKRK
jgi:hypothetical protein